MPQSVLKSTKPLLMIIHKHFETIVLINGKRGVHPTMEGGKDS